MVGPLRALSFVLLYIVSQFAAAQTQAPDVAQLLSKVSEALRSTNYRGRLTYEHSGKLEVIEIAHTVVDGREYDSIYYLNGPDRALVKSGRPSNCLNQGAMLLQGGKIRLPDGVVAKLDSAYEFKFLGEERVAGRNSWVIKVVPKDKYRHSVIIAIDRASHLPTKTLFVSNKNKVLERLHFVALDVGDHLIEQLHTPEELARKAQALPAQQSDCEQYEAALAGGSDWRPSWIPPGFVLAKYRYSDQDGHMETYTDGLASFSVFTKLVNANSRQVAASSNLVKGATTVVMGLRANINPLPVHVSVLGEIPTETASRILSSVEAVDS